MRIEKRFSHALLALALASPVTFATQLQPLSASAPSAWLIGVIDQVFAFHDAMPTGVTVSETGRIFVNFPRWGDEVPYTVAELRNGKSVPYLNVEINHQDKTRVSERFLSVQSVVADG